MTEKFGELLRKYREKRGLSQWELYGELAERRPRYTGLRSSSIISRWESGTRKPPSYETILALEEILEVPDNLLLKAAGYPPAKGKQEGDLSTFLREWAKQIDAMAPIWERWENAALSITGLTIGARLNTIAQRIFRSLGCYDVLEFKMLHDILSLCLGHRFDAQVGKMLKDIQSSLQRRKSIQEQILGDAKSGCQSLRSTELVDNNFVLVVYHFLARGDETWLEDDRFQVVQLYQESSVCRFMECPRCTHQISLQEWDKREFVCPQHRVPLVVSSPRSLPKPPENRTALYEESVVPIEYIAVEHPSKAALSMRISKMLPFSELVMAVGETDSMSRLRRFVQDFLQTSSLREEVHRTEGSLQSSYTQLLDTLRSITAVDSE